MSSELVPKSAVTRSLLEALGPIWRRVNAERTLSPGKISILRHLAAHGRATTAQLAVAIRVSAQGVSLAARELERMDLVTRSPDSDDRRRVWIVLTDEGSRTLAREAWAGQEWLDEAIAERLTAEERSLVEASIPILRKIGAELLND